MAALVAIAATAACGSGGDQNDDTHPRGNGTSGKTLLDQLAERGDRELFDHKYVTTFNGGSAILFVADAGTAAIGYLCDPETGSQWFTGTRIDDKFVLMSPSGERFEGEVAQGRLTLQRTGTDTSRLTLQETSGATIFREAVSAGLPSGLVALDGTIRGSVMVSSSTSSTSASITLPRCGLVTTTTTARTGSAENVVGLLLKGAADIRIFTHEKAVEPVHQNVQELIFGAFRRSVQDLNADKEYFLNKIAEHNAAADTLSDYLECLVERAKGVATTVTVVTTYALNNVPLRLSDRIGPILQEALATSTTTTSAGTSTTTASGTARVPSVRVEALRS